MYGPKPGENPGLNHGPGLHFCQNLLENLKRNLVLPVGCWHSLPHSKGVKKCWKTIETREGRLRAQPPQGGCCSSRLDHSLRFYAVRGLCASSRLFHKFSDSDAQRLHFEQSSHDFTMFNSRRYRFIDQDFQSVTAESSLKAPSSLQSVTANRILPSSTG